MSGATNNDGYNTVSCLCQVCGGTGRDDTDENDCQQCDGTGRIEVEEEYYQGLD